MTRAGSPRRGPLDLAARVRSRVRDVPDWPRPGVLFRDITPLLADPVTLGGVVDEIVAHWGRGTVDAVVGIEARGFLLAAPVAYHFGAGVVPARKKGKLPSRTLSAEYDLEYGRESLELHADALAPGARVVVVDDVLATGGTIGAAVDLVQRSGAEVLGASVLLEVAGLGGRDALAGHHVHAVLTV